MDNHSNKQPFEPEAESSAAKVANHGADGDKSDGATDRHVFVSGSLASMESMEHPQGEEIRRQVRFQFHMFYHCYIRLIGYRWNTTFPTKTWLPTNILWHSVVDP
jgi:hypothetical protein